MKRFYSIILTFAFLAGAIQPIVPLMEYHVFKQSIIELLCENRNVPESDCEGVCYLSEQIQENEERSRETAATSGDYYPGFVMNGDRNGTLIYPYETDGFHEFPNKASKNYISLKSPPPKVS